MAVIDEHVERILRLGERVFKQSERYPSVDLEAHHTIAQQTAAETLVLLKNDGILPLKKNATVAVIGRFADDQVRYNGGGSSWLDAYRVERPLDALKAKAKVHYAPGYDQEKVTKASTLAAIEVAKKAKTVLFFTGTTASMESEGFDRVNIDLPLTHRKLLAAIAKVNPNIVVILNNGAAVDLREVQPHARAIVEAWLLGSAAGQPIADVLFGEVNPSGKLSETFPLRLEHTPAYGNFPGQTDHVDYTEGVLAGYRHYDTRKLDVMYPFGHGLSYTTFGFGPVELSTSDMEATGSVTVRLTVTNTGKRAGAEVVQLYVQDVQSSLLRPEKELRAFKKVFLEPKASQTVTFTLSHRDFAVYVPHLGRYAVEAGTFNLLIGASSRDIRRKATLNVNSTDKVRPHLTLEYPYTQWIRYPQEKAQIDALIAVTRKPEWWETEPPLSRWLLILKREFNWSDADEARIKAALLEEA
jgi:beta-glucosidase